MTQSCSSWTTSVKLFCPQAEEEASKVPKDDVTGKVLEEGVEAKVDKVLAEVVAAGKGPLRTSLDHTVLGFPEAELELQGEEAEVAPGAANKAPKTAGEPNCNAKDGEGRTEGIVQAKPKADWVPVIAEGGRLNAAAGDAEEAPKAPGTDPELKPAPNMVKAFWGWTKQQSVSQNPGLNQGEKNLKSITNIFEYQKGNNTSQGTNAFKKKSHSPTR